MSFIGPPVIFTDGLDITAEQFNTNLDAIERVINGGIESDNLSPRPNLRMSKFYRQNNTFFYSIPVSRVKLPNFPMTVGSIYILEYMRITKMSVFMRRALQGDGATVADGNIPLKFHIYFDDSLIWDFVYDAPFKSLREEPIGHDVGPEGFLRVEMEGTLALSTANVAIRDMMIHFNMQMPAQIPRTKTGAL